MTILIPILGDQLSLSLSALRGVEQKRAVLLRMAEQTSRQEFQATLKDVVLDAEIREQVP